MKIRSATFDHIPLILDLERSSAGAAHWTEQHYSDALGPAVGTPQRLVLLAEVKSESAGNPSKGTQLLGFLVARHVASEWELENMVVAADARRQGVATRLMDALLSKVRETNSAAVFLEVRESNLAARSLYEKAGFRETGRRKMYFAAPAEDAILYRRTLP